MKRTAATLFALLIAGTILPGCATIFTGTHDDVTFNSEPEGARVFIDGIERGRTPTTIGVSRSAFNDTEVTLRMDGYEDRTFLLDKSFNAVSILNLFGLLGWAVDFATGAVMKYDPKGYDITLDRTSSAHNLDSLEKDARGAYQLPASTAPSVIIHDAENGLTLLFEK